MLLLAVAGAGPDITRSRPATAAELMAEELACLHFRDDMSEDEQAFWDCYDPTEEDALVWALKASVKDAVPDPEQSSYRSVVGRAVRHATAVMAGASSSQGAAAAAAVIAVATEAVAQPGGGEAASQATSTAAEANKVLLAANFPQLMGDFNKCTIMAESEGLSEGCRNDLVIGLSEVQELALLLEHEDQEVKSALEWLCNKCESLLISSLD